MAQFTNSFEKEQLERPDDEKVEKSGLSKIAERLKKSFNESDEKLRSRSTIRDYRPIIEIEADQKFPGLKRQSDLSLMQRLRNSGISKEEREYIEILLTNRGYQKNQKGIFERI